MTSSTSSSSSSSSKVKSGGAPGKTYTQLDPISHILKRPDMYCGSVRSRDVMEYVDIGKGRIQKKMISYPPALLRIFVEILSNAVDNAIRSITEGTPTTRIKVTIDKGSGQISVWNDGAVIPIERVANDDPANPSGAIFNHTMIFGKLLTGSNYDDEEERFVAGRNGLGSKLCNVFSKRFEVQGVALRAGEKGLRFDQAWTRNMREASAPKVQNALASVKRGYTKVTWVADFEQFYGQDGEKMTGYTDDIVSLFRRFVYDAAMVTKVKIDLDGVLINVDNLSKYAALYEAPPSPHLATSSSDEGTDETIVAPASKKEKMMFGGGTSIHDVLLQPNHSGSGEFEAISFVNGIATKFGGCHVDAWAEAIFRPIVDKFNTPTSAGAKRSGNHPKINISDVKRHFRLFVTCAVNRPEFESQEKNKLEGPLIVASTLTKPQLTSLLKWSVMADIESLLRSKEIQVLKKSEKGNSKVKIDGYDCANLAGGKRSSECVLIICEGLSAKTYAVAGIQKGVYGKQNRDFFGILPLTGKLLNTRNSSISSIAANKVITNLIQSIGLRHGIDYTDQENFKTLNYGRLMLLTDADSDGIHIEGLLLNFIHSRYPSLLQRPAADPFVVSMKTPIARIIGKNKKEGDRLFYDEDNLKVWLETAGKVTLKYYKGLGTTKIEDVKDTFGTKMVEYKSDDKVNDQMNKVFHKDNADLRKKWLADYSGGSQVSLDACGETTQMSIATFVDSELIKFSFADCARSLPSGIDGLKESQRKILYAVRKRNLKFTGQSLKVAQLSGYTAEHSSYHHGEQNLQDTIIGMAQDFVGSNNIPLFYRDGQFGSRLDGGKDAASARYIYTKMDRLTELVFRSEDDAVLTHVRDDGDFVQPEFYVPILPMLLVNGCLGIGTGWSSSIPCFNPLDIMAGLRLLLDDKHEEFAQALFVPFCRNFRGTVTSEGATKYISGGVVGGSTNKKRKASVVVSELPVGMWSNAFKERLEDMVITKKIKGFRNQCTPTDVCFEIDELADGMPCTIENLKLTTSLNLTNMVAFDRHNRIKKHVSVHTIVTDFFTVRLDYYKLRLKNQIAGTETELVKISNRLKFVEFILADITLLKMAEKDLVKTMVIHGIEPDQAATAEGGKFDTLLSMPAKSFTVEKVDKLRREVKNLLETLETLRRTRSRDVWRRELEELEEAYKKG